MNGFIFESFKNFLRKKIAGQRILDQSIEARIIFLKNEIAKFGKIEFTKSQFIELLELIDPADSNKKSPLAATNEGNLKD